MYIYIYVCVCVCVCVCLSVCVCVCEYMHVCNLVNCNFGSMLITFFILVFPNILMLYDCILRREFQ